MGKQFWDRKNFVYFVFCRFLLYFVLRFIAELFKLFWSILNGIFKGKIIIKTIFSPLYSLADLLRNPAVSFVLRSCSVSGTPTVESENHLSDCSKLRMCTTHNNYVSIRQRERDGKNKFVFFNNFWIFIKEKECIRGPSVTKHWTKKLKFSLEKSIFV